MSIKALVWAFDATIENSGAKFVLVALADAANMGAGEGRGWVDSYPSISKLMARCAMGRRTVERHLAWLEAHGWIERFEIPGRRRADARFTYVLTGALPPAKLAGRSHAKNDTITRQNGGDHTPNRRASIEEPSTEPSIEPSPESDHGFEEWWQAYPLQSGRKAAEALYRQLVLGGTVTPAELLVGARAYASTVVGKARRWVKHPTTWLHQECWADWPPTGFAGERPTAAGPIEFAGPTDIRAQVAVALGEGWARSYFDPCAWDDDGPALTPRFDHAFVKIRDDLGPWLKERGIELRPARRAAA